MRNLLKIVAIAGALVGCATAASAQQHPQSTEASVDNAQNHGHFGGYTHRGPYARYSGRHWHHRHHRGW
jgi:hypothetical protein